jgi:hypothetical protein
MAMQNLPKLALVALLLGATSIAPALAAGPSNPACPQRSNGGGEANGPAFASSQKANGGGEANGPAFAQSQSAKGAGQTGTQLAGTAPGAAPCN